jgi:RNA polymerase sigma factor (sigma-70 family)
MPDVTLEQFQTLLVQKLEYLRRIARKRLPAEADAEDVVQRAVLKVLRRLAKVEPPTARAYLCRALMNEIAQWWRENARGKEKHSLPDNVTAAGSSVDPLARVEDALDWAHDLEEARRLREEAQAVVREAVQQLTEKERLAVWACWNAGGDRQQAKATFAAGSYDMSLNRAKNKLRRVLLPHRGILAALGYSQVWELVYEALGEPPPPGDDP